MDISTPKRSRGLVLSVWLTEKQAAKLDDIRRRTGLSVSQLMRALVDQIEEVKATDGGGNDGDK